MLNIPPQAGLKRVVVVGGGFGGLKLCATLVKNPNYQVVLIDKNNFHQFPPLIYQVASAGLHVTSLAFPYRKLFARTKNFFFRMCEMRKLVAKDKYIQTSIGKLNYDYLVIATGTTTNYFGNEFIQASSMPMKTINEALGLRNALLNTFERANTCATTIERDELLNIVIVGGGPTGVELAGAIAEMREHVLPRDYPDLDMSALKISLIQAADRLLPGMSTDASAASLGYLQDMGVNVMLNTMVTDYKDHQLYFADGRSIQTQSLIWVCGVTGRRIKGFEASSYGPGNRLKVDRFNKVEGYENIFAIGDCAFMKTHLYPHGHPQMAQAAIQQGKHVALNMIRKLQGTPQQAFEYKDLGSMATIGRNKAVADLFGMHLSGFTAWFLWMGVHLMSILGVKNKISVLLDWAWSYFTYDRSNRTLMEVKNPQIIVERKFELSKRHWGEISSEQASEALVLQEAASKHVSVAQAQISVAERSTDAKTTQEDTISKEAKAVTEEVQAIKAASSSEAPSHTASVNLADREAKIASKVRAKTTRVASKAKPKAQAAAKVGETAE